MSAVIFKRPVLQLKTIVRRFSARREKIGADRVEI